MWCYRISQGIRFVGYRVFATHRLLVRENVWRFRRRLRKMQEQYARYEISLDEARRRIMSWIGHARQADSYRLRRRLFREHPFRRARAVYASGGSASPLAPASGAREVLLLPFALPATALLVPGNLLGAGP